MPGKLRCFPSISEMRKECSPYRMDFIAFSAFLGAMIVGVWLMFSFLQSLTTVTEISELLLSADVFIFMIMFVAGAVGFLFAYNLGGVSFGLRLGDIKDMFHTIGYGVIFAGVNGISALPIIYLASTPASGDMRMVAALVLLAPVGEELLWRGASYGLINAMVPSDSFPAFLGKAFVPSLMFSIGHFWALDITQASNFLFTFISGYVLNFSYWYTKKLGVPITAHFVWNLIQLISAGVV